MGIGWAHERFEQRGITECTVDWLCTDLGTEVSWDVGETTSVILVTGEPSDVRYAIGLVRHRMTDGPTGTPRPVVAVRRIAGGSESDGTPLLRRFGAKGYGLGGVTRYGYQGADAAAITGWLSSPGLRTGATFSGEVDLDWSPEPTGPPPPEPSRETVRTPGWVPDPDGLRLSWLAARTPTARVAGFLLRGVIEDAIPATTPTTPGCVAITRLIGADTHHVAVVALDRSSSDRTVPALAAVEELIASGPDEVRILAALDRYRASEQRAPVTEAIAAGQHAVWHTAGYAMPPDEPLSTDPGVLVEELRRQFATFLVSSPQEPSGTGIAASRLITPCAEATGRTHKARPALRELGLGLPNRIVVGATSITRHPGPSTISTDTVVAVERRPHGERVIYDRDGAGLLVDPLLWQRGDRIVDWVDRTFPGQIDNPEPLEPSPSVVRATLRGRPAAYLSLMVVAGLFALVLAVGFLSAPAENAVLLLLALAAVALVVLLARLLRHNRRMQRRVRGDLPA